MSNILLSLFFFKQKTAYEMRISDWSSDVCSSDLIAFTTFRKTKGKRSYFRAVRRSKDPTVFTVLFEDSAAMLGLVVAFVGIALGEALDMPVLDGVASMGIGLILAATAMLLAYESKGLLIGEAAFPEEIGRAHV